MVCETKWPPIKSFKLYIATKSGHQRPAALLATSPKTSSCPPRVKSGTSSRPSWRYPCPVLRIDRPNSPTADGRAPQLSPVLGASRRPARGPPLGPAFNVNARCQPYHLRRAFRPRIGARWPAHTHFAVLGAFVINAARNPSEHRSLIWFTIWSSIVHALILAGQSIADAHEMGHLLGDVPALLLVAVLLLLLLPSKQALAVTA